MPGEKEKPIEGISIEKDRSITSCQVAKGPALADILYDLQNVRLPSSDESIEDIGDTTSSSKRASARAKLAKEKEETLRLYEENSKACDEVMNAMLRDLDEVDKSKVSSSEMATSTETVWIRTKNKAKVIVTTNADDKVSQTTPVSTTTAVPLLKNTTTTVPASKKNPVLTDKTESVKTTGLSKAATPASIPNTVATESAPTMEVTKRKTIRLADEQIRQLASKGGSRPNTASDKRLNDPAQDEIQEEGVLNFLIRTGIKDTSSKKTAKPRNPEPKPVRTTPVKKTADLVIEPKSSATDTISTPTQSDQGSTKRQRRPTNRHSPSEANQQCQVLRRGEIRRNIPDPPTVDSRPVKVVTQSKNDTNINIVEMFGESDSDEENKDILQPNSINACIWTEDRVESPIYNTPQMITEEFITPSVVKETVSTELTPMEISLRAHLHDMTKKGDTTRIDDHPIQEEVVNVPTTACAIDIEKTINIITTKSSKRPEGHETSKKPDPTAIVTAVEIGDNKTSEAVKEDKGFKIHA